MKKIIWSLMALGATGGLWAQDAVVLNPVQSLLFVNPSFAGNAGTLRGHCAYMRVTPQLWNSGIVSGNSVDGYVKKLRGGLAVSGLISKFQLYRRLEFNVIYAPVFQLKESGIKIITSVQLTYLQNRIEEINFFHADPVLLMVPPGTRSSFDLSTGLLVNYKNWYVGGSLFHLNRPDVGIWGSNRLPSRLSLHASYNKSLRSGDVLNVTGLYNRQANFSSATISGNVLLKKHYLLGLGYVTDHSVYFSIGYRAQYFSISGLYTMQVSKFPGPSLGSTMIAGIFRLGGKSQEEPVQHFEN